MNRYNVKRHCTDKLLNEQMNEGITQYQIGSLKTKLPCGAVLRNKCQILQKIRSLDARQRWMAREVVRRNVQSLPFGQSTFGDIDTLTL